MRFFFLYNFDSHKDFSFRRSYLEINRTSLCKSNSRCVANVVVIVSRFERLHGSLPGSRVLRSAAFVRRDRRKRGDTFPSARRLSAIYRSFVKARLCTGLQRFDHPFPHRPTCSLVYNIAHDRRRLPSLHSFDVCRRCRSRVFYRAKQAATFYIPADRPLYRFTIVNNAVTTKSKINLSIYSQPIIFLSSLVKSRFLRD